MLYFSIHRIEKLRYYLFLSFKSSVFIILRSQPGTDLVIVRRVVRIEAAGAVLHAVMVDIISAAVRHVIQGTKAEQAVEALGVGACVAGEELAFAVPEEGVMPHQ